MDGYMTKVWVFLFFACDNVPWKFYYIIDNKVKISFIERV